ncbi:MAG: GAF domain-containing protein, partial [Acidobacteria bacterium]|nr:GAF domain-containing protein [Acidobacteriota bacterium]
MERSSRKAFPESLAAAMADGAAIDWRAAQVDAVGAPHADLVHQLRVIAAMRSQHGAALTTARPWLRQIVVAVFAVGVAVAAIKVLVALTGVPAALALVSSAPVEPYALNLAVFGIGGLLLVSGGGRDRRLQLLGGLYLIIASAFAEPFLVKPDGPASVLVHLLVLSKPEVFMALGVWLFAWSFPQEPVTRRGRAVAGAFLALALALVVLVFVVNVVLQHNLLADAPAVFAALDRNAPKSLYWPLLFALALPAIPFLLAKARHVGLDGRRRVQLFLVALGLGFLPIVAAVIATPFVPAFRDPAVRQNVGLVLYLALGSIVPMTAYAVAVNRVMDLQFVIRATLQYALARYAIWAVILVPISYLAVDVFVNRGLTFLQYIDARDPAGVLTLSGVGLVALTFRPQLVQAVDRWFRREPLDSALAMARLEHRFRASGNLREISVALAGELAAALHAERVDVLLQAEDGAALVALDGSAPPLPRGSVLCELLHATRSEVHLDARSAIARLLPDADQDWLIESGAEMLSPLVGSSGTLLGVVAIGAATQALPYTPSHVALVTAMCGHAAMQLENRWLREAQGGPSGPRAPLASGVAWQDEPAAWCPKCSETASSDTRRCRCGGVTRPAVLPLFVNAKFRLQRFLGAGGTGVVYLATDLALDRQVAIKTLPA